MVYFEIVPITQKEWLMPIQIKWPKPYQTLMLLELVKGLKNLGVLKKHL
jgi:hypothetical protein